MVRRTETGTFGRSWSPAGVLHGSGWTTWTVRVGWLGRFEADCLDWATRVGLLGLDGSGLGVGVMGDKVSSGKCWFIVCIFFVGFSWFGFRYRKRSRILLLSFVVYFLFSFGPVSTSGASHLNLCPLVAPGLRVLFSFPAAPRERSRMGRYDASAALWLYTFFFCQNDGL